MRSLCARITFLVHGSFLKKSYHGSSSMRGRGKTFHCMAMELIEGTISRPRILPPPSLLLRNLENSEPLTMSVPTRNIQILQSLKWYADKPVETRLLKSHSSPTALSTTAVMH